MERKPLSTTDKKNIVGAVVLLVVVLLGLYVGGYFALGKYDNPRASSFDSVVRAYRYDGLAWAYWPLARLEGAVIGDVVWSTGPTRSYASDDDFWKPGSP